MSFSEIWGILKEGGMAATFAVLWWLERQERRSALKQRDEMAERAIAAMSETASTMGVFSTLVKGAETGDKR